ncbi:hypothetical protein PpSQ1_27130, partial [Pseudomonas putida]
LLRNERSDKAQALMYMDLDGFKRINDSLGHEAGDRVLGWVAEQLKDCLGSEALLARMFTTPCFANVSFSPGSARVQP